MHLTHPVLQQLTGNAGYQCMQLDLQRGQHRCSLLHDAAVQHWVLRPRLFPVCQTQQPPLWQDRHSAVPALQVSSSHVTSPTPPPPPPLKPKPDASLADELQSCEQSVSSILL